jgi:hypothetical protein
MGRPSSGLVEDFLLLLLKFLLSQHARLSQLSEQPELGKLIALYGTGMWLALLSLVLRLLPSKQVAQPTDEQSTQQATAAKWRWPRSSHNRSSPVMVVMSLHGIAPSPRFHLLSRELLLRSVSSAIVHLALTTSSLLVYE